MPSWVSPASDVTTIIREAARAMRERQVAEGRDPVRLVDYYSAFNRAMQSVGRTHYWSFLAREGGFASKNGQQTYVITSQASATVTFTGAPTSGHRVTINGTAYAFTSAGANSQADGIAELISLVNAGTQCYALQTSSSVVTLYWSGDDGDAKTCTDTDSDANFSCTNFANGMTDFSRITALRRYGYPGLMHRENAEQMFDATGGRTVDGQPFYYAATQGDRTVRLYSSGYGGPDGVYMIQLRYQALPSAVLPNGQGRIDFPTEFSDLWPRMIQLILGMDIYDETAALGDQIVQRQLKELEQFSMDETLIDEKHTKYMLPRYVLDVRVPES